MIKFLNFFTFLLTSFSAAYATTLYSLSNPSNAANTYVTDTSDGAYLSYNSGAASLTYKPNSTVGTYNFSSVLGTFSPTSLNIGDSLSLNYTITGVTSSTFNSSNTTPFRLALLNSEGTQISNNLTGTTDSAFTNDDGIGVQYNVSSNSGKIAQKFVGNDTNLWNGSYFTAISGSPSINKPGTGTINCSLTLTLLSATQMQITATTNGTAQSVTISSTGFPTTYDSFSFYVNSGDATGTITFSTLDVIYTPVPEPQTIIFLFMGFTLIAWGYLKGQDKKITQIGFERLAKSAGEYSF